MVEASLENRFDAIASTKADQGEVFANRTGWLYRAWTVLEHVNPHREAIMMVRVARTDESAADAVLKCMGWLKRVDMPHTLMLEKRNETRLVFSKKVHTVWPYDLNWDVARSVMLTFDRQKIRYQSLIVDVSKGIPPRNFYWWPLDAATYLRQKRNHSNSTNGQACDPPVKIESAPPKSARKPDSPPQPDASVRRMLSETRFYSKSDDPDIAQKEWSDYTHFMGVYGLSLWKRNVGPPADTAPKRVALRLIALVVAIMIGALLGWLARRGSHATIVGLGSFPLLVVPLLLAALSVSIGLGLAWWARANVLKSGSWRAQERDPDALTRKGFRFPYLWRLTRADLEIACVDNPRILRAEEWGFSFVALGFVGWAFASGVSQFPTDRSGAWTAGILASAMGLMVIGFIWRHFARFSVRMIGVTLAGTAVFLSAGLFIIRSLYHQYYSSMGIRSDVDISQSDLVQVGGPLAGQMIMSVAAFAIVWLVIYRHRFAQPFNWLLATVFIVGAMLPLASAVDDASRAGSWIGSAKSNSLGQYAASVVCVRPIGHDPVPIEYQGHSSLVEAQTARLWRIGTAGTQTILLDPAAAAAAHARNEKSGSTAAIPVQFVPSSTITIRHCDPGTAK